MRIWTTSSGTKIIKVLGGRSNVFLVTNGRSNLLVDTSAHFMWTTLRRRLKELNVDKIDLLILTHSHFDHASNAAGIKEKYNARVLIHKTEASYLSAGDNILPTGTNIVTRFLVRVFARKFQSFARYQPCDPDINIDDDFDLSGFGFNSYITHTPGHTQGSLSVIVDNEVALVGDTMFGIFFWSVFPPFASDQKILINSWDRLLKTNSRYFLPSHGTENKRILVEKDYNKRKRIK